MRHQRQRYQLSRSASHRKALLMNLCKEVIDTSASSTTEAKAKAVKPELEQLITLAKRGDLHARRQALSALGQDKFVVYKLFEEIAPRYSSAPAATRAFSSWGRAAPIPRRWCCSELVSDGSSRPLSRIRRARSSPGGRGSPVSAPLRGGRAGAGGRCCGAIVTVTVAGRTDAGVHAWGQVASYAASPRACEPQRAVARRRGGAVMRARARRLRRPSRRDRAGLLLRLLLRRRGRRSRGGVPCTGRASSILSCSRGAPPRSWARTTSPPSRRRRPSTCTSRARCSKPSGGVAGGRARVLDRGRCVHAPDDPGAGGNDARGGLGAPLAGGVRGVVGGAAPGRRRGARRLRAACTWRRSGTGASGCCHGVCQFM